MRGLKLKGSGAEVMLFNALRQRNARMMNFKVLRYILTLDTITQSTKDLSGNRKTLCSRHDLLVQCAMYQDVPMFFSTSTPRLLLRHQPFFEQARPSSRRTSIYPQFYQHPDSFQLMDQAFQVADRFRPV